MLLRSDPTIEQANHTIQMLYACIILYTCCSTAVKMSILLLYRRIFVTRVFGIITALLGTVLMIWSLCILLLQIFFCKPIHDFWEPTDEKHCLDGPVAYLAISVSNVIWDFTLLLLPLPMIWSLNMTKKRKLQLCAVFLVGILYVGSTTPSHLIVQSVLTVLLAYVSAAFCE